MSTDLYGKTLKLITHQVLVGASLSCSELDVVPADEQKQEEGQHEELPVPHCHKEDLKRQSMKHHIILQHLTPVYKSQQNCSPKTNGFNHVPDVTRSTTVA